MLDEVDPGTSGGSATSQTTAQEAFDATSPRTWQLTLTQPQRVYFGVEDDGVLDNQGGLSLAISAPEPGTLISLATGAALLVLLDRRRQGSR